MYVCHRSLAVQNYVIYVCLSQVLSSSIAEALAYFGHPDTSETEVFLRHFDRFFDCLNVRNKCGLKGKKDLKAAETCGKFMLYVTIIVLIVIH